MNTKHFNKELAAIKERRIRLALEAHTLWATKTITNDEYKKIGQAISEIQNAETEIFNVFADKSN